MDSSIEVLEGSAADSDVEVIFKSVKPVKQDGAPVIRQLPPRRRRPIVTLQQEQLEEQEMHEQKLQKKRLKQSGSALLSTKKLPSSSVKRKNVNESPQVTKIQKTVKSEVGGAGTIKCRKNSSDDPNIVFAWDPAKLISERQGVTEWQAKNVITMFDQENTLPFIARYRKEKTGNLDVEKLREIQNSYAQLKNVQEKVAKALKTNHKELTENRRCSLLSATTLHEVEHLTAAFKTSGKRTYAERAKELGLEVHAKSFMTSDNNMFLNRQELYNLLDPSKDGLRTIEEVEQGLQHIMADSISKDPKVLKYVQNLVRNCQPTIECHRAKKVQKKAGKVSSKATPSEELCAKYENYFNFKSPVWNVRPHCILAMNRGEQQGVLNMKVVIPDSACGCFHNFCQSLWLSTSLPVHYRSQLMMKSIEDSYDRLVKPFMQRQVRSELKQKAELSSVEVFAANLRKLLLTPPVRGNTVIAIDPGFLNGCKIGVCGHNGDVLLTTTIYPFKGYQHLSGIHWSKDHNAMTLREIVIKYSCEFFAIGNGKGCREMETYLSQLITLNCFSPFVVQYTIVNESGISQYSVSPEAKVEFPDLDPTHVSAVSLARRLQDPLLEYIKVHPMHLGVGMYQHDISEKILYASLDSVMTECVSFVGLDINVASEFAMRKVSGLNKLRAANIVEYRKTKGPFRNREQIRSVKGIGPKTFEQCAGFIKILPQTLESVIAKSPVKKKSVHKINLLDQTTIHPESYDSATKFIQLLQLHIEDIGSDNFIQSIRQFMQSNNLNAVADKCGCSYSTMQLIVESLTQPLDFDIRAQFEKPLFRKGITSFDDLSVGSKLTGTVRNVTQFGAFVDVGVGQDGLIHSSKMMNMQVELGNIVEVMVLSVDKARNRIGLRLVKIIG